MATSQLGKVTGIEHIYRLWRNQREALPIFQAQGVGHIDVTADRFLLLVQPTLLELLRFSPGLSWLAMSRLATSFSS